MTRMERKRRRQRQIRRCVALFGTVVVVMMTVISDLVADTRAEEKDQEPTVQARARVEMPEMELPVVAETEELVIETEQAETEEDESVETEYLREEIPLDFDFQSHLVSVCREYGVPYEIALGVIQAESSFRANAQNGSCYGYMQVNKINADWLKTAIGVTDLTDPYQNVRAGVYILSGLYADYDNWHKALIAYKWGAAGAQKHVFSKGYTTTEYSRTVMSYADKWAEVILQ